MEYKIGTDIIEVARIEHSIQSLGENFLNRVFTQNEITYCESKNNAKYQHYAARFAAKEAVFKALSSFLENKFSIGWKDVEILNDEQGRPYVAIHLDMPYKLNIDISMSHIKEYAIATAICSGTKR